MEASSSSSTARVRKKNKEHAYTKQLYLSYQPPQQTPKKKAEDSAKEYKRARKKAKIGDLAGAITEIERTARGSRDLTLYGDIVQKKLDKLAGVQKIRQPKITNTEKNEMLGHWTMFNQNNRWVPTDKTLVLTGGSGIGKTALAAILLNNALYVTHLEALKAYRNSPYNGIVIDYINFERFTIEQQIHLVDRTQTTQIETGNGTAIIPAETPMIIIGNDSSGLNMHVAAVKRHCTLIIMFSKSEFEEEI